MNSQLGPEQKAQPRGKQALLDPAASPIAPPNGGPEERLSHTSTGASGLLQQPGLSHPDDTDAASQEGDTIMRTLNSMANMPPASMTPHSGSRASSPDRTHSSTGAAQDPDRRTANSTPLSPYQDSNSKRMTPFSHSPGQPGLSATRPSPHAGRSERSLDDRSAGPAANGDASKPEAATPPVGVPRVSSRRERTSTDDTATKLPRWERGSRASEDGPASGPRNGRIRRTTSDTEPGPSSAPTLGTNHRQAVGIPASRPPLDPASSAADASPSSRQLSARAARGGGEQRVRLSTSSMRAHGSSLHQDARQDSGLSEMLVARDLGRTYPGSVSTQPPLSRHQSTWEGGAVQQASDIHLNMEGDGGDDNDGGAAKRQEDGRRLRQTLPTDSTLEPAAAEAPGAGQGAASPTQPIEGGRDVRQGLSRSQAEFLGPSFGRERGTGTSSGGQRVRERERSSRAPPTTSLANLNVSLDTIASLDPRSDRRWDPRDRIWVWLEQSEVGTPPPPAVLPPDDPEVRSQPSRPSTRDYGPAIPAVGGASLGGAPPSGAPTPQLVIAKPKARAEIVTSPPAQRRSLWREIFFCCTKRE